MNKGLKIYLAHPISGLSAEEVMGYYEDLNFLLTSYGYMVFHPMVGKGEFRNETKFKAVDQGLTGLTTNHAIIERDCWMCSNADVVYVNLIGAKTASIGCIMELAWAHLLRKHTVVALDENNPNRHAFVLEAADILFDNEKDAENYLKKLINIEI